MRNCCILIAAIGFFLPALGCGPEPSLIPPSWPDLDDGGMDTGEAIADAAMPLDASAPPDARTPDAAPPRSPPLCQGQLLTRPLGRGQFGVQNVRITNGQTRAYCVPLEVAARRVRIEISKQCLGANFIMRVTPGATHFSDGQPMHTIESTRSASYGARTKPDGYVPANTFAVEVRGLLVGNNCPGASVYHLTWSIEP